MQAIGKLRPLHWYDQGANGVDGSIAETEVGGYSIYWSGGCWRWKLCRFGKVAGGKCDSASHGKQLAETDYARRVAALFEPTDLVRTAATIATDPKVGDAIEIREALVDSTSEEEFEIDVTLRVLGVADEHVWFKQYGVGRKTVHIEQWRERLAKSKATKIFIEGKWVVDNGVRT